MRSFAILLSALLLSVSAYAQDLLVKRNGEQMRVKVLKITKKKVQFVRYGTEVPIYSLPVSDISYIEYPMGDRDTFGKKEEPKEELKEAPKVVVNKTPPTGNEDAGRAWHGSVPPPSGDTPIRVEVQTEEQRYAVGDIYDKDGVKGIVVVLYNGGLHGLVMSLDETCLAWCNLHRKKIKKTNIFILQRNF